MFGKILTAAAAILFLAAAAPPPLRAGDDIRAVSALWDDFTAALRRGDYQAAHGLFSPESRLALPYADFVREYGPLSAARELVLAVPESRSTRVDGEWAEIASSGGLADSGKRLSVSAAAVKNQGTWGLVAARNEAAERLEARARSLLRRFAAWRGRPDAAKRLEEWSAAAAAKGDPLFSRYRFEGDGVHFRAVPLSPGWRRFQLDPWGEPRPDGASPATPPPPAPEYGGGARTAGPGQGRAPALPGLSPDSSSAAIPPPPAKDRPGGLPELGEPPAAGLAEMPEPPEPPPAAGKSADPGFEPGPVSLPDAIR